ncbi:TetR/AcrR family transcriptional regulator [Lusitaniella coriacea LEGE 07157]|uniref:TetR/AcrR family transcriptional regulator n=1 Tax=Lusitaniella coriacea LEGE 07157 TaxID=945747 RepID=A0A8J7IR84_9CYAN|nr:TetR/AcrR family transcriptional regulator [Lusitaniella coriacea]MBE9115592.1 TetR/AcrR family transcriptional regulator [Lusitaniella coriacea LEGE 07157]
MVKKNKIAKLGQQDWIDLGLKVLEESGIEAVRVEPLAKLLGVTKGSFYWHFKNREEFLEAILQAWVSQQTDSIIEQVEAMGGDAVTKLLHLFELAIEDDGRVENAIRAWAAHDSRIAATLNQVDSRRLNYTKNLFLSVGFTPFEAVVRARMVYYSLIGEFTLGTRSNREERLTEIRLQHKILTRRE